MKSFVRNLSNRFPFFANRPSALERAVRQSLKSRRLRMEPLEKRALLAVDAFGGAASLAESNVAESWGPDPEPAAFSASILATDAAIIDVSGVNATLDAASFSVQAETPEPVAPPSFDQLMESLGMIEIESLGDGSDAASLSYLDATDATQVAETQAEARQVVFYDSSAADFDASTLNLDDESVYYVDAANAGDAESNSATPRSGGGSGDSGGSGGSSSSGGSSNSGGTSSSGGSNAGTSNGGYLTTYGSSSIRESATFTGSGGSDQGPYFGFATPAIPGGCWAYVRFEGGDAEYGKDYVVRCATVGEDGVVTPNMNYVSGGAAPNNAYDIYVYGPATYCVVPLNDYIWESPEDVVATLYFDMLSGGSDVDPSPVAYDSFTATIIDDDATFSVYWRDNSSSSGAPQSGNPNGGGARFFPEQTNPNASSLKNKVDLVFELNALSSEDMVIYYRLLDPDNNISLGYGQPADSSFIGGDNNNRNGFNELSYGFSAPAVFIPAGTTEYALTLTLSDAYAGDNFIVVAGRDASRVAVAELGTTATTRYEVVQPTNATDETKLRQTQNLTVWRTIWAERDQLTLAPDNVIQAGIPSIGGVVTSEPARACIRIKDYAPNLTVSVNGPMFLSNDFRAHINEINKQGMDLPVNPEYNEVCIPFTSSNFWGAHIIGAFRVSQEQESN